MSTRLVAAYAAAGLLLLAGCSGRTAGKPGVGAAAGAPNVIHIFEGAPGDSGAIFYYDAAENALYIADPDAMVRLEEEIEGWPIVWSPGQVVAQVNPGGGMAPRQASVFQITNRDLARRVARVGDMRSLKYLRRRVEYTEMSTQCYGGGSGYSVGTPSGARTMRFDGRTREVLLLPGTLSMVEFVANTLRQNYYATQDCTGQPVVLQEFSPEWVVSAQAFPPP